MHVFLDSLLNLIQLALTRLAVLRLARSRPFCHPLVILIFLKVPGVSEPFSEKETTFYSKDPFACRLYIREWA